MSIFYESVLDNLERNLRNQEMYKEQINALPKGRVVVRKRRNSGYCYLEFRKETRICNIYLGLSGSEKVMNVQEQIAERDTYKKRLASLVAEEKEMRTALKAIVSSIGQ